jgi:hypothetical protein
MALRIKKTPRMAGLSAKGTLKGEKRADFTLARISAAVDQELYGGVGASVDQRLQHGAEARHDRVARVVVPADHQLPAVSPHAVDRAGAGREYVAIEDRVTAAASE